MPHQLDIRCPSCEEKATFEFAEFVRIKKKDQIDFFVNSEQFEYRICYENFRGEKWHAAVFFPGLHGGVENIQHLPDGYSKSDWEHSNYVRISNVNLGSVTCSSCGSHCKHELAWEKDAYYQIEFKGKILWAFNRDSMTELLRYIASVERDVSRYRWSGFLMKVPAIFLKKKSRESVVKRLDRALKS